MTADTTVQTELTPSAEPDDQPGRGPRSDSFVVTLLAILLALIIGGILMAVADPVVRSDAGYFFQHPMDTISQSWYTIRDAYRALFDGAIYNTEPDSTTPTFAPITGTIWTAGPLIAAGLGISLAFRAGLFNIGGQGQVIAGAFASAYVGFAWHLPIVVHLVVALLAGILGGAIWGFVAGYLKARTGAHEVITTIMLNYVALYGLNYLIGLSGIVDPTNPQQTKTIDESARLPHLFGSSLPVDLGIVLAIAAAVAVWWILTRSRLGFQLRAVGANPAAARTAGMNTARLTMAGLAIAGSLAGLAGAMLSLGGFEQYHIDNGIDNGVGFNAITVALLGRNSPAGVVAAGLLFGALEQGAPTMTAQANVSGDIVTVIQALIVIFVAAPRLTRAIFRLKGRGRGALTGLSTNLAVTAATVRSTRVPRHVLSGAGEIVLGVLALFAFALGVRSRHTSIFHFSLSGDRFSLGTWHVEARWVALALCLLVILAGVLRLTQKLSGPWCASIAIFGLLVSFMTWSIASDPNGLNVVSLLQGALFPAAIPLILGALAGVIGERAGVVNVALEGQLLLGAFAAAFVGSISGSVWGGIIGGALAGAVVAMLLSVLAIRYLVDQVIVGVVLNVFVLGVTNFLFDQVASSNPARYNTPGFLHPFRIPLLSDIPIFGDVFFDGTLFLYFSYVAVAAVSYALFHTRWGLRVRSVGEHPRAADTVGIKVNRTRYNAMLIAGLIAGLAGAMLVLGEGQGNTFSSDMSSGYGYIALAAVIFGRWTPRGAVLAALLFGFASQLQSLLSQASPPIDPNILLMAPYLATIIAVAGFVGRVRPPAADGQPYTVG